MSRHAPPDHRDPKATAGLRIRRERRGLPVGKLEEIFDPAGNVIAVGTRVRCGNEPSGVVVSIDSVADNEGTAPIVRVAWPEGPDQPEPFITGVRDYRREGPLGPYDYRCDDLEVVS